MNARMWENCCLCEGISGCTQTWGNPDGCACVLLNTMSSINRKSIFFTKTIVKIMYYLFFVLLTWGSQTFCSLFTQHPPYLLYTGCHRTGVWAGGVGNTASAPQLADSMPAAQAIQMCCRHLPHCWNSLTRCKFRADTSHTHPQPSNLSTLF